jgi:hypothetical protein
VLLEVGSRFLIGLSLDRLRGGDPRVTLGGDPHYPIDDISITLIRVMVERQWDISSWIHKI